MTQHEHYRWIAQCAHYDRPVSIDQTSAGGPNCNVRIGIPCSFVTQSPATRSLRKKVHCACTDAGKVLCTMTSITFAIIHLNLATLQSAWSLDGALLVTGRYTRFCHNLYSLELDFLHSTAA